MTINDGDFDYVIFILGYDLLHDYLINSESAETDTTYNKCKLIADEFFKSSYNDNTKDLYECVEDFLKNDVLWGYWL